MIYMQVPSRNVFIEDVRKMINPEIEDRERIFVLYKGGLPFATICWSSPDSRTAQQWLRKNSFKRCGVNGCGIRRPCSTHQAI